MFVVAAAVPLLLVGACSEDPEPKFAPPSATPTPSVTESAEPEPAAWEEKSTEGAVAFARHWVEVFNEAQMTGNTSDLRAASAPSCGTCAGVADQVDELYKGGGRLQSEGWSVRQAVPTPDIPNGQARIAMRVYRAAQVVTFGDKRDDRKFAASQVTLSARLVWRDGAWCMTDLFGVG